MLKTVLAFSLCCMLYTVHAQYSNVQRGEILDINGVKGIVFTVDEDHEHGTVMSIQALRGIKNAWCRNKKYFKKTEAFSEDDGQANTKAIFRFVEENGVDLESFPAFAWCKKLGEGWYIPSRRELEQFIYYWLGSDNELDWDNEDSGVDIQNPGEKAKEINKKLIEAGGVPFHNLVYTSTEAKDGGIFIFGKSEIKKWWRFLKRGKGFAGQYCVGRAFYDF